MTPRFRPLPILALLLALSMTCATAPANPNATKYPPHGGNCKIRVLHAATPDVKEWDDIAIARVECPLDVGAVQCLRKLRSEACRMGGDLLYDVPKKPLRPSEQAMIYMGHVAHTKTRPEDLAKDDETEGGEGDQDQPTFEGTGPVEPIRPGAAASADGGPPVDGGG
jgi:hypothetical protein